MNNPTITRAKFWSLPKYYFRILYLGLVWIILSQAVYAVHVKYRGEVDLSNGYFINVNLKPSSFVHEIHYDSENNYLIVRLNYTYYHYCGIPVQVVETWVNSNSLGRFYNYYIKGNYDCRDGGIPDYQELD